MRQNEGNTPRVHSLNDLVAAGYGCRTTLYGAINRGELRATKFGPLTKIRDDDLKDWLASQPAYERPGTQRKKTRRRRRQP
jgi:excisionase family DNA binding protein